MKKVLFTILFVAFGMLLMENVATTNVKRVDTSDQSAVISTPSEYHVIAHAVVLVKEQATVDRCSHLYSLIIEKTQNPEVAPMPDLSKDNNYSRAKGIKLITRSMISNMPNNHLCGSNLRIRC